MLDAVLERITYANEETGYTIARVATDRSGSDLLTVVGALLGVQPGESLRLVGRWSSHPRYGRQFEVESYTTVLPATIQGIERYLGSGLIKGIGPRTAGRIVGHFGVDTLRVIEEEPRRLVEVAGLGPKRTAMIGRAWEEQKAIKEVMVFLQGVGVSTSLAVRIYKKYGDGSISVVRHEPYRLAAEVWGIGFKTADTIAQAVGIPHDSPQRVQAGIQYTLSEAADHGHCYLPEPNLLTDAAQILGVPADLVRSCLADLAAAEGVICEPVPGIGGATIPAVYLVPFHRAETALAAALLRLLAASGDRMPAFGTVDWAKALAWLRARTGAELAAEQEQAVRLALTQRVAVLTGGPGCGKSFTVKSVITLAAAKRAKVVLAAPTGRAAKRLAELSGHPATTVHRLLQLRPGGEPSFDRDHPLDADLIVVDEASMLDLILANKLIKAVHRVEGGRELPRHRSSPVSAGAGRCGLSSTVMAVRACSWRSVPARARPFVSEWLARSHSKGAHDWVRVCRPHRGGSSPCSVPLLSPDRARSGCRAAGCGEYCGQLVARHPLPIATRGRRCDGEPQTSGKSARTITRSALASSVICAGVRPRISPSTSRSMGGSVWSQTLRAVRNGV